MISLLQADYDASGIMPPALKNRPLLPSHLHCYHEAYSSLRCHRTRSEAGYNPISYESIVLYAQVNGFMSSNEVFEVFLTLVQSCDHAFLEFVDEKQQQAIAKMKAKS